MFSKPTENIQLKSIFKEDNSDESGQLSDTRCVRDAILGRKMLKN